MLTRRKLLLGLASMIGSGAAAVSYAFAGEPFRLRVQRYAFTPARWTGGLNLKVALLADLHACNPWMDLTHIQHIVEHTNSLGADLILLLGDYESRHRWITSLVPMRDWTAALAGLRAPLGVHAILGNHDWWDDAKAQRTRTGPVQIRAALERAGLPVYENDVVRLTKNGHPFWLAGLGDQLALVRRQQGRRYIDGVDNLPGTLAKITDDAPILLMAHEPDIFPRVPERVSLTVSGHTHGGQIRLFGYSPVVPSRYGNRFAYGHIEERAAPGSQPRHLVVSGGLGCSLIPVRFGVPPEIVLLDLGAHAVAAS